MLLIGMIIGFFLGAIVIGVLTGAVLRKLLSGESEADAQSVAEHIDYKDRWLAAVKLLGGEGQLTDEQVTEITRGATASPQAVRDLKGLSQEVLNDMFSDDRRDLEIARAKNGLPPIDDLNDMFSDDIRDVMKARAKYGTG